MHHLPLRSFAGFHRTEQDLIPTWAWLMLALLAVAEAIWLLATPLRLAPGVGGQLLILGANATALLLLGHYFRKWERLHVIAFGLAWLLLAWPVLRLFNHLTMTLGAPLADHQLAAWDAAIGFDWSAYLGLVDSYPWLLRAMDVTYGSLTSYMCLLFLLLALSPCAMQRCRELIVIFLSTALLCSTVGAMFPALAAAAFYPVPPGMFETIEPSVGSYHLEALASLRSDPSHMFVLTALPGLVTFPSFHTAMGVIGIYCARGRPWLFAPSLVINGIMIASTPIYGSHYGVDVLAGAAVAGMVILVHRRMMRRSSAISSNNTCRTRPGSGWSPSASPLPT